MQQRDAGPLLELRAPVPEDAARKKANRERAEFVKERRRKRAVRNQTLRAQDLTSEVDTDDDEDEDDDGVGYGGPDGLYLGGSSPPNWNELERDDSPPPPVGEGATTVLPPPPPLGPNFLAFKVVNFCAQVLIFIQTCSQSRIACIASRSSKHVVFPTHRSGGR